MKNLTAWCTVALLAAALGPSCSSSSESNENDDDGGRGASGGASSSGAANRGGSSNSGEGGQRDDGGAAGTATGTGGDGGTSTSGGNTGAGGNGASSGDSATGGSSGSGTSGDAGVGGTPGGGTGNGGDSGKGGSGGSGGCVGLECQVIDDACPSSSPTTLTGTVFAPNGTLPIYNARVYVPRTSTLGAIADQVSCTTCRSPLSTPPVTVALSDATGHFRLEGVPSGSNVPFVIELGKWRRMVTIPTVTKCIENPALNAESTRLPKNQAEGHIPRIAITTGSAEALECIPRRLGVVDNEFSTDGGSGRIHLYAGGAGTNSFNLGGMFAAATTLWSNPSKLASYDMVLLSCEGSTSQWVSQKPPASIANLTSYVNGGGRVFYSHLHSYWLSQPNGFPTTATYSTGQSPPPDGILASVNQAVPRGAAFAQWLSSPAVGATTTLGQVALYGSEHTVTAVTPPTTEWLSIATNPSNNQHSAQVISFNAPLSDPPASQCGRAMFGDVHFKEGTVEGGGDDSDVGKPFPTGCKTNAMTAQGKALAFLFFDLSGCVQPDTLAPSVP